MARRKITRTTTVTRTTQTVEMGEGTAKSYERYYRDHLGEKGKRWAV